MTNHTTTTPDPALIHAARTLCNHVGLEVVPDGAVVLNGHAKNLVRGLLFRSLEDYRRTITGPQPMFGGDSFLMRDAAAATYAVLQHVDPDGARDWRKRNGGPRDWVTGPRADAPVA